MPSHKINKILNCKKTAKKFNKEYLLNMADWNNDISYNSIGSFKVDGFTYKYNSSWEKSIIQNLKRNKYSKLVRGQNLVIDYKRKRKNTTLSKYQPDIVLLNYKNQVVIIEVKPLENMIAEENRRKMLFLENYCQHNGYLWCMCDNRFRDIKSLKKVEVPIRFKKAFFEILYKNKRFVADDIPCVKSHLRTGKKRTGLFIAALVYQYNLKCIKGDLTINSAKLLIKEKLNSKKLEKKYY